ncbi:MAG: hypothetical protein JW751_05360 [Polyangiaceae bacterium]|nr:hypothetical protein [Polyangiaceae bacterium]
MDGRDGRTHPGGHPVATRLSVSAFEARTLDVLVLRNLERRHLTRQCDRVIDQLRIGDFRAAEVKKLRDSGIYRAKLDDKNRLLFKLGEHGGRKALLILEVVHNHDYAKARFLGGGSFTEDDFQPVAAPAFELPASERLGYVHPTSPALHVLDKPLSFDDAQEAVFATPLPLIVIGSAGSGKTALTLEKLKTLPGRGLYLTRSSYLVENARALFFANRYDNSGQEVDFLSLAELLQTIDVPRGREARWAEFSTFYDRVRGTFRLREAHRIYEELKGVITGAATNGPYMTEDEYLALGVRQTIFLGEERRVVYRIFERWRAHLTDSGLFDGNIAAWERLTLAQETYDFLVVDEVQDVTMVELRLALATLREKGSFLLCGDSNQIVHPNLFSWARVKALFFGEALAGGSSPVDQIHVLSANYRNTRAVTALANRLLLVKQRRFGSIDRESNFLVECVSGDLGRVDLLTDTPTVRAEIEDKTRRSSRTAILVLRDEDKPTARAVFSTPLVFSVQEAKGLEYDNVVLFNLVSGAAREFRECTEGVSAAALEGELVYARARDKADKSLDAYKFYVNALYVAMTRAVKSLLVVEGEPGHPLFELLAIGQTSERIDLVKDESSREDWQREARRLELQGSTEQAEQIRREILECQPVPWQVADASTLAGIRARALGPGPHDKAAQQLLFEYGLTYDAPGLVTALAAAGFRHAKKPESGREYIHLTHYREYAYRSSPALEGQLRKYGVDFRNPLNETPLMVAARLGRAERVAALLAQGADPALTDAAGRTALRVALAGWLDQRGVRPADFVAVFRSLSVAPIKVKVGSRMAKLDPSSMEWFILNLCLVQYRRMVADAVAQRELPAFKAPTLAGLLAMFPDGAVPPHRKRREYISSILAKNEIGGSNPYNRRLFYRAARGFYVLNPALEVEARGTWISVVEMMGLPLLLDALGPSGDYLRIWLDRTRTLLRMRHGPEDGPRMEVAPATHPP